MFKKILNVFKIPELRNKLLFTLGLLMVYRIGFYIPVPGVDAHKMAERAQSASSSALGALSNYLSTFSGGSLGQSTIFGLGIMPYITASIILQLLSTVVPSLEKLKKEGEPGIRKINEWTRYLTVGVCFIQAWMLMSQVYTNNGGELIFSSVKSYFNTSFWIMSVFSLTAGSLFLMWLGEQIDHYGIGNGVSLIISAGIIARMPDAIIKLFGKTSFNISGSADGIGPGHLIFLAACFVFVVAAAIFLTQAQRRITINQAKQVRGRKVYGGSKQYLPLRINHAGVMPIIFASSLMLFPVMLVNWLPSTVKDSHNWWGQTVYILHRDMNQGTYLYEVLFCLLIFFFSYFWNTVQFNPKEMATQLRDYGSFIPGIRPGKRTADFLEAVMMRITYVGAGFLCVIAIIPSIAGTYLLYDKLGPDAYQITQFLGGTGLLIVISVMLDLVNRIEANLVMRNYSGFMDDDRNSGSGAKFRRPKGASSAARVPDPKGLPA